MVKSNNIFHQLTSRAYRHGTSSLNIEGLNHSGIGWQSRQAHTPFGSGFRGTIGVTDSFIQSFMGTARLGEASALTIEREMARKMHLGVTGILEEGLGAMPEPEINLLRKVKNELGNFLTTDRPRVSFIPTNVPLQDIKELIAHERVHLDWDKIGGSLPKPPDTKLEDFLKGMEGSVYQSEGYTKDLFKEEYYAYGRSMKYGAESREVFKDMIPVQSRRLMQGKGQRIEGLPEQGLAEPSRKKNTDFGSPFKGANPLRPKFFTPNRQIKQRIRQAATQTMKTLRERNQRQGVYLQKQMVRAY
jgi:hypothetical protein